MISLARRSVLVATAAAWNVLQNRVLPRWSYPLVNAAGTIVFIELAQRLGASKDDLGLNPRSLPRGIAYGVATGAIAASAIAAAARVAPAWFRDDRVVGTNARYEALVRIPFGTALFEETVFRGVLQAALGPRASSALFGLWHALPASDTARTNGLPVAPVAAAGVIATGVSGLGFARLRDTSGSLAAPVIAHAAINVAAYLAAHHSHGGR